MVTFVDSSEKLLRVELVGNLDEKAFFPSLHQEILEEVQTLVFQIKSSEFVYSAINDVFAPLDKYITFKSLDDFSFQSDNSA
jgi:hypothetical protein